MYADDQEKKQKIFAKLYRYKEMPQNILRNYICIREHEFTGDTRPSFVPLLPH